MKPYLLLCLAALLISASADYSFDIVSSTEDNVVFEYGCYGNGACREPGEEYCGDNQIETMMCVDNEICEVQCKPLKTRGVNEDWPSTFTVIPKDKKVGEEINFIVKDTRNNEPLICDVDLYFGGRWETEQLTGATHWGETLAVVDNFVDSKYTGGTLLESTHTDRQGVLAYMPLKPGRYVLRAVNKYIVFKVADESGDAYECPNAVCEGTLGEDETVCPQDCEEASASENDSGQDALVPPGNSCGDGICGDSESERNCPADCQSPVEGCIAEGQTGSSACCAGLERVGAYSTGPGAGECVLLRMLGPCVKCGDGICGSGEDICSCPQDCAQPVKAGGGDMTITIVIVAIIAAAAVLVVFLVISGKFGGGKKSKSASNVAPPITPTTVANPVGPPKCAHCGANLVQSSAFCVNCGKRV